MNLGGNVVIYPWNCHKEGTDFPLMAKMIILLKEKYSICNLLTLKWMLQNYGLFISLWCKDNSLESFLHSCLLSWWLWMRLLWPPSKVVAFILEYSLLEGVEWPTSLIKMTSSFWESAEETLTTEASTLTLTNEKQLLGRVAAYRLHREFESGAFLSYFLCWDGLFNDEAAHVTPNLLSDSTGWTWLESVLWYMDTRSTVGRYVNELHQESSARNLNYFTFLSNIYIANDSR